MLQLSPIHYYSFQVRFLLPFHNKGFPRDVSVSLGFPIFHSHYPNRETLNKFKKRNQDFSTKTQVRERVQARDSLKYAPFEETCSVRFNKSVTSRLKKVEHQKRKVGTKKQSVESLKNFGLIWNEN